MKISKQHRRLVPALVFAALLIGGPMVTAPVVIAAEPAAARQQSENIVTGSVLGVSNKAKTISIDVKGNTEMVKFNDDTKGMEHAVKGHPAIIEFTMKAGEKVATVVKPKLAELPPGVTMISTDEVAALVSKGPEAGNYFLVDSRPPRRYDQGHIPTAVSITLPKLKETGAAYLPGDAKLKNTLLIFYCGGPSCTLSPDSAKAARSMGYTNIRVYMEGEPAWSKSGKLLQASDKFVNTGNIVLVDLRSPEEAAKGHIKKAVNIPMAQLAAAEEKFPTNKSAPIVLYGHDETVRQAKSQLNEWGYKLVSAVNGSVEKFVARGNKLVAGSSASDIKWVRTLEKGEVTIPDFLKAAAEPKTDTVILDIRESDEIADGKFPNALHIPLSQLPGRMGELPKDKELLVHCATGARAEMAWQSISKAGLKARYLMANVACEGGKCQAAD